MAANQFKPDENLDPIKSAINNNPCGICRAIGVPVCKGHGAGGGASDDSSEQEFDVKDQEISHKVATIDLEKSLGNSALWLKPDDLLFEFNHADSLVSIKINMEEGTLSFLGKDDLSADQNIALQELYDSIELEFNEFRKDSAATSNQMQLSRVGNELKIKITDPKLFDAFVQRLLDKNILTTNLGQSLKGQYTAGSEVKQEQEKQYHSPSPFDISGGPKPE